MGRVLPPGETPVRSIRIPADVAEAVRRDAHRLGASFTDVVVEALRRWLAQDRHDRVMR